MVDWAKLTANKMGIIIDRSIGFGYVLLVILKSV